MNINLSSMGLTIALLTFSPVSLDAHAAPTPSYALAGSYHLPGSTRWDYLTFEKESHRLFITRGDSVDVWDTNIKKVVGTISNLDGVHGVAIARDLHKGFISEGKSDQVTVFDLTSFTVLATIHTGHKPDAIIYDPATKRVFSANGESEDLTAIDATTNTVVGTIKLGGEPEFAAVDEKGQLYVNLQNKGQIEVIDTKELKTLTSYNLAPTCEGPTGLAIDKEHDRLFTTCANNNMLVVDASSGKILDTLPIGQHSDAAAFDAGTGLAFSSNGDGTLTILGLYDGGHYKLLQTVQTKLTARTMALDPSTHTVYLVAAETEGFDPATEKHPSPRPHIKPDTFMILTVGGSK